MENTKRDLMITEATREEFKVPKDRCEELAYYQTVEDIKEALLNRCEGENHVEEDVDVMVGRICDNLENGKTQEVLQETIDLCIQTEVTETTLKHLKDHTSDPIEEKESISEKEGE